MFRAQFNLHAMQDQYQHIMALVQEEQEKRQMARKSVSQARKSALSSRQQERLQRIEDRYALHQITSAVKKYSAPSRRW